MGTSTALAPLTLENQFFIQSNSVKGWNIPPRSESQVFVGESMAKLALCESGGNPQAVNWFDHGSPSYGKYQYKETTWKEKIRQYGLLPQAEDSELMNFIFDENVQDRLTFLILSNEKEGWRLWTNCLKDYYY